ncbi:MAG: hypothetical protein JNJ55_12960, partial [Betaproteobacteria bacterium]|nr:hypothetical protein [Betaproteobacteria bacterium]
MMRIPRFLQQRKLATGLAALFSLAAPSTMAQTAIAGMSFSNDVEASLVRAIESLRDAGIKPA